MPFDDMSENPFSKKKKNPLEMLMDPAYKADNGSSGAMEEMNFMPQSKPETSFGGVSAAPNQAMANQAKALGLGSQLAGLGMMGMSAPAAATAGTTAATSGAGALALSNPVTAAGVTVLGGLLANNMQIKANEEQRRRQALADLHSGQANREIQKGQQRSNAFQQLMQGYTSALR